MDSSSTRVNLSGNEADDGVNTGLDMRTVARQENGSHLRQISPISTYLQTLSGSDVWNKPSRHVGSLTIQELKKISEVANKDGFSFAVSLPKGSFIYTSNMAQHLEYSKVSLENQDLMSILYCQDHFTFANQLTQGLNACFVDESKEHALLGLNAFFCRIRKYQAPDDGFPAKYKAFWINFQINELINDDQKLSRTLCANAIAYPLPSAYSVPEEIPTTALFSTRHTASCHFTHLDKSAIPYLGYLPQDVIGFSIFDFYHAEDIPLLKNIYELVVKGRGSAFRSKPYRFKIRNGCYIVIETEWSCFIDPWTHNLECVIGHHRVLKGPTDVDIFCPSESEDSFPDELLQESLLIQQEIKHLLSEKIYVRKYNRFSAKKRREMIKFVYNNFIRDDDDETSSECNSMMGDISPVQEVSGSSIASETPPTVQQMRLKENMERFFASDPRTYCCLSEKSNMNENNSSGDRSQTSNSGSGNASGTAKVSGSISASNCQQDNQTPTTKQDSKKNSVVSADSGFSKSAENQKQQASSPPQQDTWSPREDLKQLPTCLALTQKSLSFHNRINFKQYIQQQKNKSCLGKRSLNDNWMSLNDSSKQKQMKMSTPTQTEDLYGAEQNGAKDCKAPSVPTANAASSVLFPPGNAGGSGPIPFFIPVMYMGNLPYCPNPQNPQSFWPFGPTVPPPSQAEKPEPRLEFDNLPSTSAQPTFAESTLCGSFKQGLEEFQAPLLPSKAAEKCASQQPTRGKCRIPNTDTSEKEDSTDESQSPQILSDSLESATDISLKVDLSPSFSSTSKSYSFYSKEEDMDCDKDDSAKVEVSSEIALRYQIPVPNLEDILKRDREALNSMLQPELVNEQLFLLQQEREQTNKCKVNVGTEDFNVTENIMLGLNDKVTDDNLNGEVSVRIP